MPIEKRGLWLSKRLSKPEFQMKFYKLQFSLGYLSNLSTFQTEYETSNLKIHLKNQYLVQRIEVLQLASITY